jgi:hypothetical protein
VHIMSLPFPPFPRAHLGGFYDHQPNPDVGVPAPDDVKGEKDKELAIKSCS